MPDAGGNADLRSAVLRELGASASETVELLAYGSNHFTLPSGPLLPLPLSPEPHVEVWREYAEAQGRGVVTQLRRALVQAHFPVAEGMSESADYRAATRRMQDPSEMATATGLPFADPDGLRILLHPSPAGETPVVLARARADFVALVQAILKRNEPVAVPASTGAYLVVGYNNLDRIRRERKAWEANPTSSGAWALKEILPHKERYQDRFILVSQGPYSGVPAMEMGLNEEAWLTTSLAIRVEHECTHYFTRRVLGSMRSAALDEVLADTMGLMAGFGRIEASSLCRVLGVSDEGAPLPGGRLANYAGDPPLSEGAFGVLCRLVARVAGVLEALGGRLSAESWEPRGRGVLLLALASLTLEEMAAEDGLARLDEAHGRAGAQVAPEQTSVHRASLRVR